MASHAKVNLQSIFEMSPDAIVVTDRDSRVLQVNNAFALLLAKEIESFCGVSLESIENELHLHADPLEVWPSLAALVSPSPSSTLKPLSSTAQTTAEALVDRRSRKRQKIFLSSPETKVFERSFNLTPEGGRVFYYRDITREIRITRKKDQFLAATAHEIRNPLASIVGFSEILKNSATLTEEASEFATLIYEQAVEVARLIDELLDLARIESEFGRSFTLKSCAIAQFIAQFVDVTIRDPRFSRLSYTSSCPDFVVVNIDPDKLTQALRNIVSNAAKYSEDHQPISLSLEVVQTSEIPHVSIKITDRGMGIAPEDQAHLFEPFFRASAAKHVQGTGLGLSLVDEIIRHHRGLINVKSALGSGTCIEILLPLAEND